MAYLGYRIPSGEMPERRLQGSEFWAEIAPSTAIMTAHALLINRDTIPLLISYLEAMLARPAGSLQGGPMHVDGAYSWFRNAHPEMRTLITHVPYIGQRSLRSDIAPAGIKERLPFLPLLRRIRNRVER